jgi:two-component system, response regulator
MGGFNMNDNVINILLVEDNPDDVELTIRALKKHNIANNLFVVNDGEEALDFIFAQGKYSERNFLNFPKVVFLDLKLPKVDGIEVLKAIKSNEETKSIPVVVMTTSQEERDIIDSYKFGVNSYITKPINFEKFVDIVSQLGFYWLILNKNPF